MPCHPQRSVVIPSAERGIFDAQTLNEVHGMRVKDPRSALGMTTCASGVLNEVKRVRVKDPSLDARDDRLTLCASILRF